MTYSKWDELDWRLEIGSSHESTCMFFDTPIDLFTLSRDGTRLGVNKPENLYAYIGNLYIFPVISQDISKIRISLS